MLEQISMKSVLEKQQYRIVGEHSAVKVCKWTKDSLLNRNFCYKQKFYGIQSHRCLQMTPCLGCNFLCTFCWRAHPQDLGIKREEMPRKWDDPEEIIDGCIEKQRELLSGFGGNPAVDKKKLEEARQPNQTAISLTGEPMLYPKISDLIDAFHSRNFTTFLVTNGSEPSRLARLQEPTCLYISLDAPDKKTFIKTDRPMIQDAWENVNKSLSLLASFSCRTVVRITLVRGLNMLNPLGYAKIINKAGPDFLEVKAYMAVGFSVRRLPYSAMPSHAEVRKFAKEIAKNSDYDLVDEKEDSRVVLLRY